MISGKIAKAVFEEMYTTAKAKAIVEEKGLVQVKDEGAIEAIIDEVLRENPTEVVQPTGAARKSFSAFSSGRSCGKPRERPIPKLVNEILRRKLATEER